MIDILKESFKRKEFGNLDILVLPISAVLILFGAIALIADFTWCYFPAGFDGIKMNAAHHILSPAALWCLLFGIAFGVIAVIRLRITAPSSNASDYSKIMFGRCLVGIGFVLMVDAIINTVAVAGFANAGAVPLLFRSGGTNFILKVTSSASANGASTNHTDFSSVTNSALLSEDANQSNRLAGAVSTDGLTTYKQTEFKVSGRQNLTTEQERLITAIQLLFALGFTLMGALFFFATSLWEKMKNPPPEGFDERVFWAGLWFRLGEAIVFTLVVFVALLFTDQQQIAAGMPFIALIIGLSVKSMERLIAGISNRFLNAIQAFIG